MGIVRRAIWQPLVATFGVKQLMEVGSARAEVDDKGRRRRRRSIAAALAAIGAASISLLTAPSAHAGDCNVEVVCGRVWNWTNSTIRLASLEAQYSGRCVVRTWPRKDKFADYKNDGKAACRTTNLGSGGYSGSKMKDTDAFTFSRKFSLGGIEYSAGTFVKMSNLAQVVCVNPFDTMPRCKFLGT